MSEPRPVAVPPALHPMLPGSARAGMQATGCRRTLPGTGSRPTRGEPRVTVGSPEGSLYWRMQITGRDVTGDSDYCGEGGGQLVHYAYLLEDQDREDAEELGTVRREWE